MEPAKQPTPGTDPNPGHREPSPAAPAPAPAAEQNGGEPERQPGESAELEALRLARRADEIAGGLVARLDQVETKLVRVDRQVLILIGMVAVVTYTVKAIAGRIPEVADAAAPAS
jgi:hypothetical protein